MKLFLDDLRNPCSNDFDIVRSSESAIKFCEVNGCPSFISFDHDLGGDDTAMNFLKWLIETDMNMKTFIPDDFSFHVHSANPIGKENIEFLLTNYLKFRKIN